MPAAACIAVLPLARADEPVALDLSRELGCDLLRSGTDPARYTEKPLLLQVDGGRLALQLTGRRAPGPVWVDFGAGEMRHRRSGGHNELLGRAVGVGKKSPLGVVDATAGLGRDSFVLADLGCRVLLCERHRVVQQLLRSGLRRAAAGDTWLAAVSARMQLHCGDARDLAPRDLSGVDVIYLDPMFPRRRKSAAVKKEMVVFQLLLGERAADGGEELLAWALRQAVARVVVKRPPGAAELGGHRASHAIAGKAVRFDVYVMRALGDEASPASG